MNSQINTSQKNGLRTAAIATTVKKNVIFGCDVYF